MLQDFASDQSFDAAALSPQELRLNSSCVWARRRFRLKLSRNVVTGTSKFFSNKDSRILKHKEHEEKQKKLCAKSISLSIKHFWKVIEQMALQRRQTLELSQQKLEIEQRRENLLHSATKFAQKISLGLSYWHSGVDKEGQNSSRDDALSELQSNAESSDDSEYLGYKNQWRKQKAEDDALDEELTDSSAYSSDEGVSIVETLKREAEVGLDELRQRHGSKVAPAHFEESRFDRQLLPSAKFDEHQGCSFVVANNDQKRLKLKDESDKSKAASRDDRSPRSLHASKQHLHGGNGTNFTSFTSLKDSDKTPANTLCHCCPIPHLLRATLRNYQHEGLTYLLTLHDSEANGILADEMGLGKTIQTISLLAYLACYRGIWGPHLIVVPSSILLNWEMEFHRFLPGFNILAYYGNRRERERKRQGWNDPHAFNVCVVSYAVVVADAHLFRRKAWYYMVLDEAHHIKNYQSQKWQTLLHFNTQRRLLLTGTPIQNDLSELWALAHFLMPSVFSSHSDWKCMFSNQLSEAIEKSTVDEEKEVIHKLHDILRPFLLRRLKKEVEAQMPGKFEHVVRCRLSRRGKALYNEYIESSGLLKDETSTDYFKLLNILMQLRKICNHPDLAAPRHIWTPLLIPSIAACKHPSYRIFQAQLRPSEMMSAFRLVPNKQTYEPTSEDALLSGFNPLLLCNQSKQSLPFLRNWGDVKMSLCSQTRVRHHGYRLHHLLDSSLSTQNSLPLSICHRCHQRNEVTALSLSLRAESRQREIIEDTPRIIQNPLFERLMGCLEGSSSNCQFLQSVFEKAKQQAVAKNFANDCKKLNYKEFKSACDSLHTIVSEEAKRYGADSKGCHENGTLLTHESLRFVIAFLSLLGRSQQLEYITNNPVQKNDPRSLWLTKQSQRPRTQEMIKAATPNGISSSLVDMSRIDLARHHLFTPMGSLQRISSKFAFAHTKYANKDLINLSSSFLASNFTIVALLSQFRPLLECAMCFTSNVKIGYQNSFLYDSLLREQCSNCIEESFSLIQQAAAFYHPIEIAMQCAKPSRSSLQDDCGKLQILAELLFRLKSKHHKCILFTQMARMLDILESFMSYHHYTYVRLDGSTKIEDRQRLVDRFNNDSRIFVFMASTRVGGLGLNLTAADTVIIYDTDWNPAIDRQAMDRCHRIGQTREVHCYRLITEGTIEENILKKQLQKRMLDEVVVDRGRFSLEGLPFLESYRVEDILKTHSDMSDLYTTQVLHESTAPSKNDSDATRIPDAATNLFCSDTAETGYLSDFGEEAHGNYDSFITSKDDIESMTLPIKIHSSSSIPSCHRFSKNSAFNVSMDVAEDRGSHQPAAQLFWLQPSLFDQKKFKITVSPNKAFYAAKIVVYALNLIEKAIAVNASVPEA